MEATSELSPLRPATFLSAIKNRAYTPTVKSRRGFLGAVLGLLSAEFALLRGAVGAPPSVTPINSTLDKFIADKRRQAEAFDKELKLKTAKEVWDFFDAASAGDRKKAAQLREVLGSLDSIWQIVNEVNYAVQQLAPPENRFARRFGEEILSAVAANAIYLGGTEAGRYIPTALSESHIEGRPFFTLTQHHFASRPYLQYALAMYGAKINIPSIDDLEKQEEENRADARRRWEHDQANPGGPRQLKPGEDVHIVDGRVQVAGHMAVLQVSARIAKLLFERNPNREFYVEESFPFDWMYPHLIAAGSIMKLNRAPVDGISVEAMEKDREYWTGLCREFLGLVVTPKTTIGEVKNFVTRVDLDKKLQGTDAAFVGNDQMRKAFSKLRSSQGGLYAWRLAKVKNHPQLQIQAEIAFKQAWALYPKSPEALFRYVNLLLYTNRIEEALLLVTTSQKLDPDNPSLRDLTGELGKMLRDKQRRPPTAL